MLAYRFFQGRYVAGIVVEIADVTNLGLIAHFQQPFGGLIHHRGGSAR
jgi:hypothetical protein